MGFFLAITRPCPRREVWAADRLWRLKRRKKPAGATGTLKPTCTAVSGASIPLGLVSGAVFKREQLGARTGFAVNERRTGLLLPISA